VVKVAEGAAPGPALAALDASGARVGPLFSRPPAALRADRAAFDPDRRLADLTLYFHARVDPARAGALADALNRRPDVEIAYLAHAPTPPPEDLPPTTPDFSGEQLYLGPAPDGLGLQEAAAWPGGRGGNVTVADVEYGFDATHEDLSHLDVLTVGATHQDYLFLYHGTGVLGELSAGDNGYGVIGMVPDAAVVVSYPFGAEDQLNTYSIADAISRAAALLSVGDVLLIEQQSYDFGDYAPASWDAATFDAIALAVAAGVVVVEPAGNGAQDLDDERWGGWFDPAERDSGSIMVGGGASPLSGLTPRSYYAAGGSCYGARVNVQGWYDHIVTATSDDYGDWLADLYYPDGDGRQAYTSSFGGTSGASPMVAAVAAAAQSVALAVHGQPFDPLDLRALMISTGSPQAEEGEQHVGPQPDLRGLLRAGMLP